MRVCFSCRLLVKELIECELKAQFCKDALGTADKFTKPEVLEQDLIDAIKWVGARTPEEVRHYRRRIMAQIEAAAAEMWKTGQCRRWLAHADEFIKLVVTNFARFALTVYSACFAGIPAG